MPRTDQQMANMLLGGGGGVGDVDIAPNYPGAYRGAGVGLSVQPRYIGAPINRVDANTPLDRAVNVSATQYVAADTTWFGLGSTTIPASDRVTIQLKPLRPFVPQRQYHPSTIQDLLIRSASIGGTNIYSNVAGVPVELFSEVSTSPQIEWPTLETSVGIDFEVENLVAIAQPFRGALYGTAARR